MPLIEHVRELRNRIFVSFGAILLGGVAGWVLYGRVIDFLIGPYNRVAAERGNASLVTVNFDTITSGFNIHVKIAFFVGLALAAPVWMYELWAFIMPGLKKTEKKYAFGFLGAALPLFVLGGYLATRVIPVAIRFLVDLTPRGASAVQGIDNVIAFATKMILGFAIMFVLPVLLVALNMVGVLPARTLVKGWRVAILIIFVLSAMASPSPDPGSMLLLAIPVVVLFAMALGVCYFNDRRRGLLSNEPDYEQFADDEASPIEPTRNEEL